MAWLLSAAFASPVHLPAPQPAPLLLGHFRLRPIVLPRVIEHARPTLCDQSAGEVLTAAGRAHGHKRDGAGLGLGAATQAPAADPVAKGILGQLRAGPACPVPSTADGVLVNS